MKRGAAMGESVQRALKTRGEPPPGEVASKSATADTPPESSGRGPTMASPTGAAGKLRPLLRRRRVVAIPTRCVRQPGNHETAGEAVVSLCPPGGALGT